MGVRDTDGVIFIKIMNERIRTCSLILKSQPHNMLQKSRKPYHINAKFPPFIKKELLSTAFKRFME